MSPSPTLTRVNDWSPGKFALVLNRLPAKHKQSTYVFHNGSSKMVAAYVFQWTGVGGTEAGISYQAFDGMSGIGAPPTAPPSYGMEPTQDRIVSPAFNIHERSVSDVAMGNNLTHAITGNRISQAIESGTTYTPALDLVIYADGTFSGPDTMGFSDRMIADRNARHDIGAEVLRALQDGKTDADVSALLNADLTKAALVTTDKGHDLYVKARGRYAEQLLTLNARLGPGPFWSTRTSLPGCVRSSSSAFPKAITA